MLGNGAYGQVKKIKVNDSYFALKETVLPEYPEEIEVIIACLREEAMHLEHPHIIVRKWCRFMNNKFQLCMELGEPVYKADERRILHDITQALYFMHSKGFIHRDVKPENIVKVGKRYKLIDFGLTRKGKCNETLTGYMVSRWFRPPELLQAGLSARYDGRVDMYSLALTAYYLQNEKPLFKGDDKEILSMYEGYTPQGVYRHLICDYRFRYSSEKLLKHCNVTPIDGTEGEIPYREGNIAKFAEALREGNDNLALEYGHRNIYNEL